MAIINKPYNILVSGQYFDASTDITVTWSISGAIQTAKEILIKLNSDGSTVHTLTKISSYAQSYIIPASTLTNGNSYQIFITAYDSANNSATSDAVVFACSSAPTLSSAPPIVNAPSALFQATYSQAQSVPMRSWIGYLYNSLQQELTNTGIQTTSTIEYTFSGLETDETYYYEFQATSNYNMSCTTGKIAFTPSFSQPTLRVNIDIQNTSDAGVKMTWDAFQIIGTGNNISYIGGQEVDVTNGSVVFDSGYLIDNNFTYKEWLRSVTNYLFNININTSIVASNLMPSTSNKIWIDDDSLTGDTALSIIASPNQPLASGYLWIDDPDLIVDRNMTLNMDTIAPTSNPTATLWLDLDLDLNTVTLAEIKGSEGSYYLRYYNGTFYLYENDTIIDSIVSSGTSYYVLIQQINGTATLTVQVLS